MALAKPMAQEHEQQAKSNYQLFQQLKSEGKHLDWAVTLLFYTALHLMQAYFVESASTGFDVPRGHSDRSSYVSRKLPTLYTAYRTLETRSRWARYTLDKPKPNLVSLDELHNGVFTEIVEELKLKGICL